MARTVDKDDIDVSGYWNRAWRIVRLEGVITVDHWPHGVDTVERITLDFSEDEARKLLAEIQEALAG